MFQEVMKGKLCSFVGLLLLAVGTVFLLNSFSGMTGFVVLENVGKGASGVLGIVLVLGGILMFMARAHHHRFYEEIAVRVYDSLGTRNAYGHKTEQVSLTEARIAAHGPFDQSDVRNVINREIESGRLLLDKSGYAISITTRPDKVEEIGRIFGKRMRKDVLDRLSELERGRLPAGVR